MQQKQRCCIALQQQSDAQEGMLVLILRAAFCVPTSHRMVCGNKVSSYNNSTNNHNNTESRVLCERTSRLCWQLASRTLIRSAVHIIVMHEISGTLKQGRTRSTQQPGARSANGEYASMHTHSLCWQTVHNVRHNTRTHSYNFNAQHLLTSRTIAHALLELKTNKPLQAHHPKTNCRAMLQHVSDMHAMCMPRRVFVCLPNQPATK
jgi:hypothetical protein